MVVGMRMSCRETCDPARTWTCAKKGRLKKEVIHEGWEGTRMSDGPGLHRAADIQFLWREPGLASSTCHLCSYFQVLSVLRLSLSRLLSPEFLRKTAHKLESDSSGLRKIL